MYSQKTVRLFQQTIYDLVSDFGVFSNEMKYTLSMLILYSCCTFKYKKVKKIMVKRFKIYLTFFDIVMEHIFWKVFWARNILGIFHLKSKNIF